MSFILKSMVKVWPFLA